MVRGVMPRSGRPLASALTEVRRSRELFRQPLRARARCGRLARRPQQQARPGVSRRLVVWGQSGSEWLGRAAHPSRPGFGEKTRILWLPSASPDCTDTKTAPLIDIQHSWWARPVIPCWPDASPRPLVLDAATREAVRLGVCAKRAAGNEQDRHGSDRQAARAGRRPTGHRSPTPSPPRVSGTAGGPCG